MASSPVRNTDTLNKQASLAFTITKSILLQRPSFMKSPEERDQDVLGEILDLNRALDTIRSTDPTMNAYLIH